MRNLPFASRPFVKWFLPLGACFYRHSRTARPQRVPAAIGQVDGKCAFRKSEVLGGPETAPGAATASKTELLLATFHLSGPRSTNLISAYRRRFARRFIDRDDNDTELGAALRSFQANRHAGEDVPDREVVRASHADIRAAGEDARVRSRDVRVRS